MARVMQTWQNPPRVVFLSLHDNGFYRTAARELGAVGLVGKANFMLELLPVIAGLANDIQDSQATNLSSAS